MESDRKDLLRILSYTASIVLMSAIIYYSDILGILRSEKISFSSLLAIALLIGNLPIFLSAFGWKKSLGDLKADLNLKNWILLRFSSLFISNSTPFGDAGGEPFVSKLLSEKAGSDYGETLGRVGATDLLFNLPYIVLGPITAFYLVVTKGILSNVLITLITALTILISAVLVLKPFSGIIAPDSLSKFFSRIKSGFNKGLSHPERIIPASSIGIVNFLLESFCLFLVFAALGEIVRPGLVLVLIPTARLFNLTPTIGGIGSYETGLSFLIQATTELSLQYSLTVALVFRTVTFYPGLLAGFICFNLYIKNFKFGA